MFNSDDATWYYYDVFSILKWLVTQIPDEKISTTITTEIDGELFSEVEVENGIVKNYIKTEIVSEEEKVTKRKILAKDLKEFLAENS